MTVRRSFDLQPHFPGEDGAAVEVRLDIQRVIVKLPPHLRKVALLLRTTASGNRSSHRQNSIGHLSLRAADTRSIRRSGNHAGAAPETWRCAMRPPGWSRPIRCGPCSGTAARRWTGDTSSNSFRSSGTGTCISARSSTSASRRGIAPDLAEVLALIDRLCPNRLQDENQRRDWHLATAMMPAYAARYATDDFEVIALEKNFEGPIVNPATGAASRSFVLAGKVDGIVRIGDEHFILEHKTAGAGRRRLPGKALDRLPDHHLRPLYRADDGHPHHRHSLQRAGEGQASAEQGRDGRGIPSAARGAAGEIENRQDHGEAEAAGVR